MNPHSALEKSVNWLLNNSLQAGVLVLLVLLVQWIFRRQLTSRWRFTLWWVVIVRLLLPFGPESAVSVFNFFRPAIALAGPRKYAPVQPAAPAEKTVTQISPGPAARVENSLPSPSEPRAPASGEPDSFQHAGRTPALPGTIPRHALSFDEFLIPGLTGLWLAGVLTLSGCVLAQLLRFRKQLSRAVAPPAGPNNARAERGQPCPREGRQDAAETRGQGCPRSSPALLELLDDCRRELGVARRVELLETDAVTSPALFGFFELRLLLPRGLAEKFTPRELRYIFLHELAHVKRGDPWINWLVTILQIVHWFNPLVWLGFARLRADRELACDELALLRAGEKAGTSYGETIIKLLEGLSRPRAIPGLVGILEDKKQMRRRISMIANFHKPSRWSALAVVLLLALAAAALTDAQTEKPSTSRSSRREEAQTSRSSKSTDGESQSLLTSAATVQKDSETNSVADTSRPDLKGAVQAKGGAALPASVFIATAAPKTGTSTFCPSCYADCRKSAKADAKGNFQIESLDPQLTFHVLAVAKGYKPKFVSKVDPAKGPVNIELEPIESSDATPEHSLRGRVVDAKGEPIEGAVVEMEGVRTKDGGGGWGAIPGVDPLAVTDGRGEFLITAKDPFDMMDVKVAARTFADKGFIKLPSGDKRNELVMTEGAALKGRVLLDGKPLKGVSIGVSGVDRSAGEYIGHFEVGTDTNGGFMLVNLPPDADYFIYGLMSTMKQSGAIPIQKIHSAKDGGTTDAGNLLVGPAHRLAGRVVLSDGEPVPAKTRLLVSREQAWDSMQLTLDQDGNFDAAGVPLETISLSVRLKDYHVSGQNISVDQLNPFQLIGRVDHDITNLVFMLEKGPDPQPDYSHVDPDYGQSRQRSLRGAEGVPDHSREWIVSGRVLDSETKQPVQNFRVTPGQPDNFNRTAWNTLRAVAGSNGNYFTYVSKRVAEPLLKVEAEGYLPESAALLPHDGTNVDFVLKKGSGPAGFVVTPDGKPAVEATVVLLGDDYNQAGFNSKGELTAYMNKSALRTADTSGNFVFKPVWGMKSVAAASSNGFAVVSLESLAINSRITLEPFGKITGTLKRASGPGTNEDLDLSFSDRPSSGIPRINLSHHAVTDSQGRFVFDRVPPGGLRISYRDELAGANRGSWSSNPLRDVELKPGQNLEVNIETTDRPGPDKTSSFQSYQPPQPKRIAGAEIKGVVLLPDGKPADAVDVALQIEGKYLAVGKGAFSAGSGRSEGWLVSAGADGSFTLPTYEGAQSVIALNEEGIAQVSLEQLKASPQIKLQKWGRVEGTLRIGRHPGTNEQVLLSDQRPGASQIRLRKPGQQTNDLATTNAGPIALNLPIYDFNAFKTRTDDQGHFVMTFVPPGKHTIARLVASGDNSWSHHPLGPVEVKPGETAQVSFGGNGRSVIAKLKFGKDSGQIDLKNAQASIRSPVSKILKQLQQLKTDEDQKAFYQTNMLAKAMADYRDYPATLLPDGSFRAEDVPPGKYELGVQLNNPNEVLSGPMRQTSFTVFSSPADIVIAETEDKSDDSPVDLGTVELEKLTIPLPGQERSAK